MTVPKQSCRDGERWVGLTYLGVRLCKTDDGLNVEGEGEGCVGDAPGFLALPILPLPPACH